MTSWQIFAGNHLKTLINVKHVSAKTVGGILIFVTLIFIMRVCFKFWNSTLFYIKHKKERLLKGVQVYLMHEFFKGICFIMSTYLKSAHGSY
jgi:hypothetical protein